MTTVDWKGELQAVHDDGRVFAAAVSMHRLDGNSCVVWHVDGLRHEGAFTPHGEPVAAWSFHIRNTPANKHRDPCGICGAVECEGNEAHVISPELQQRMVDLVREMAAVDYRFGELGWESHAEARAIVADPGFPAEVDEDLVEARRIVSEILSGPNREAALVGKWDDSISFKAALAALRRGKQMAGEV
jgi:hypothetical protein